MLRSGIRLNTDRIINGISKPLLASQISLRRLDADVPEQELDLFQLATTLVAQPSTRATEVMGSHVAEVARLALLHHAPDDFGTEAMRGNSPRFVDRAEDRSIGYSRLRHPGLECSRNPEWHWNRPNMTALADDMQGGVRPPAAG
jgi:hypothetical protein